MSGWLQEGLRTFHRRHERVKTAVHTAWRYPLPPAGRAMMGFVYFTIPVIGGWYVMQWAISKSHESIGERGERLPVRTSNMQAGIGGDKRSRVIILPDGEEEVREQRVGAGGWGGGVHLAISDEETQRRNRKMLNKFLKQQRRKHEKEEENN